MSRLDALARAWADLPMSETVVVAYALDSGAEDAIVRAASMWGRMLEALAKGDVRGALRFAGEYLATKGALLTEHSVAAFGVRSLAWAGSRARLGLPEPYDRHPTVTP